MNWIVICLSSTFLLGTSKTLHAGIGPIEISPSESLELLCEPTVEHEIVHTVRFSYETGNWIYGDSLKVVFNEKLLGAAEASLTSEKKVNMSESQIFERHSDRTILGTKTVKLGAASLTDDYKHFVRFQGTLQSMLFNQDLVGTLSLTLQARKDESSRWTDVLTTPIEIECIKSEQAD